MNVWMDIEAEPSRWVYWPTEEEWSAELFRVMALASEGGSTVAECFLAASKIRTGDDNSWHLAWTSLADANRRRASAALSNGDLVTARSNWLRAITYYQAAAFPFEFADGRQKQALGNMRECARSYLQCRAPAGEVVSIPWLTDYPLQGYYLPATIEVEPAPAIICIGEPGQRKESLLKLERHARERGLSLLALDLLGQDDGERLHDVIGRPELESAVSHALDYLLARADVDQDRIGIVADECASSFVARAVSSDPRFAACACDGGVWDLHERAFLTARASSYDSAPVIGEAPPIGQTIKCPLLVTVGEHGWLKVQRVSQMVKRLAVHRSRVTLKVFEECETASEQGHMDNPTLANEFIFDWMATRLGAARSRARP